MSDIAILIGSIVYITQFWSIKVGPTEWPILLNWFHWHVILHIWVVDNFGTIFDTSLIFDESCEHKTLQNSQQTTI